MSHLVLADALSQFHGLSCGPFLSVDAALNSCERCCAFELLNGVHPLYYKLRALHAALFEKMACWLNKRRPYLQELVPCCRCCILHQVMCV
jgi:hypothetical protein